jgi:hypothetical protein
MKITGNNKTRYLVLAHYKAEKTVTQLQWIVYSGAVIFPAPDKESVVVCSSVLENM